MCTCGFTYVKIQVRLMLEDEEFDDPHDEGGWEGRKEDDDPKRPRVRSLPQAVTKVYGVCV